MRLAYPLSISARLMPAVRFETFTVSLDPSGWVIHVDFHGDADDVESITDDTFRPGLLRGTDEEMVRAAMASVLSFIGAFAESHEYALRTGREGEHSDLFPARFAEWAMHESDEISMTAYDLEERP